MKNIRNLFDEVVSINTNTYSWLKGLVTMSLLFLFIGTGINNLFSQVECGFEPPTNTIESTEYLSGPLYIKLYLAVIRDDNGYGGWTDEQVDAYIQDLEDVFGEHDIYFNICISEIWNTTYLLNGYGGPELYDDGINGYLQLNGGNSMFPPEKRFWASNTEGVATHELGHCLGLFHTFNIVVENTLSCNEHTPYYVGSTLNWGSNSSTAGDLVYDTPADFTKKNIIGPACPNTFKVKFKDCMLVNPAEGTEEILDEENHPYIDVEDPNNPGEYYLANNIMNYGSLNCRSLITPGQAERIRTERSIGPDIFDDEKKPIGYNKDIYVYNDENWDEDRIINGNVYLYSGSLSIHANIKFTPGHGIKVAAGTSLNMSNCTLDVELTDYCGEGNNGDKWAGITYDFNLPGSGNPWVVINHTTIKNAEKAFSNVGFYSYNPLVLVVFNSEVINNKFAVDFSNTEGSIIKFVNTKIYLDSDMSDAGDAQIKLVNSGARFIDCEIENKIGGAYTSIDGVKFYQSNLFVTRGHIKKWDYGVDGIRGNILRFRSTDIVENKEVGISVNRLIFLDVSKSRFIDNGFGAIDISARYRNDASFKSNYFKNNYTDIKFNYAWNTFFYNNIFEDTYEDAIHHSGYPHNNKSLFLCNQLKNSGNNHIITHGGMYPIQAGKDVFGNLTSAGNTFEPVSGYNFSADADNIVYKYELTNEEPITYDGIFLSQISNPAICANNPLGDDDDDDINGNGDTSGEDDKWTKEVDKKNQLEDTIATCGGGNTVLDTIVYVTLATSESVATMLTDMGPWLSDEAAVAFIQNADMFTPTQIVSVLSANPDALLNETVYQFALGSNSALSVSAQSQLQSVFGTVTAKTKLLVELNFVNMKIRKIINNAIQKVLFIDNGFVDFDNLRNWIGRKGSFESEIEIADTYVSQHDFAASISYLQGLLSNPILDMEQIADVNNYIIINQLLSIAYQNNRYEATLNSTEISALEVIANSNQGLARNKARGILEYFYGFVFENQMIPGKEKKVNKSPRRDIRSINNVQITPNPNDGQFEIDLVNIASDIKIIRVRILSFDGKTVIDKIYNSNKIKITLDNMRTGVYIYNLTDSKGELHTGKLIIK